MTLSDDLFRRILRAALVTTCTCIAVVAAAEDTDGDGMADEFETEFDLQAEVDDRYEDPDEDGFPNLAEFLHNTDPSDPESFPSDCRVVGSVAFPTLMDALEGETPEDGTVVLIPPGHYVLGSGGATLAERMFIIGQGNDVFATVISAASAGDSGNTGLIVAEKDLYLAGITLAAQGTAGTGVRLASETGHSAFVRCAFRGHVTAIQSGTVTVPCAGIVDVQGCLLADGKADATSRCYGLKLHGDHEVHLSFSTIYGLVTNLPSGNDGMAIWVDGEEAKVEVKNSVLWNAGGEEIWCADTTPEVTIGHSYVRGSSASVGTESNLLMKQGFLLPDSPCIDKASSSDPRPALDIRGDVRPAGTAPDIGAHEFRANGDGGNTWNGDLDGDGVLDWRELQLFGSLFHHTDSDGDGTLDGMDVNPTDGSQTVLTLTITKPAPAP